MKKSFGVNIVIVLILACCFACVSGKEGTVSTGNPGAVATPSGSIKVRQTVFAVKEISGSSGAADLYFSKMAIPKAITPYVSPLVFVKEKSGLKLSRTGEYPYSVDGTATFFSGDGFSIERISITIDVERMPDILDRITVRFTIAELQGSGAIYKADPAGYALSRAIERSSAQAGTAWITQAAFNPEMQEFSFEAGIGK